MRAIQPRFGVAYRVREKLVVRGGWGRYYLNPSNNYIQSIGFSTSTPLVSSLDGGRTPIPNLINNPFPTGLLLPPGAIRWAAHQSRPKPDGGESKIHSAAHGPVLVRDPIPAARATPRVDASYVGSRGNNLESSQAVNFIPLSLRQQCDAWEGGTASFCQALVPNPFYQLAPFNGTSYFSSPTLARSTLATPIHSSAASHVDQNAQRVLV